MMTITDYTADLERKKDLVAVTKSFLYDELSNQAQLFAEENFTWTFPSQDLAWTVI
ncbi:hypothetical protein [Lactiplantibacillus plantarum]